ncbi:LLM class flavin-dependent oxidoreductase [Rhodococcus sp. NPDC057014]|uniref:LLM class flavin-dependent oxidoreductase n=1 Tax=Rhodococcus sp. NPDC057014 TaxID=3346000 RepID=UPI0036307DBB
MEFGFFVQGYVPASEQRSDPGAEHRVIREDLELCVAADAGGFKYAWMPEHHFTDEYSHMSANDVFLGALTARTERMHLGSGIFNPLPRFNHPAALAERAAMLDHLSNGRFEFGTGRGSGSQEVVGFYPEFENANNTREIWEETIGEFAKMWTQEVYEGFSGKHWSMDARPILPKPYSKPHPPMWYAAGNPSSFEMAGRMGLGVLGFAVEGIGPAVKAVEVYKKAIVDAEPVGSYVNDNVLAGVLACFIDEDRDAARRAFFDSNHSYLVGNAMRYHDQAPKPPGFPEWPQIPPNPDEATLDMMIEMGAAIVGDPDDVLAQVKRFEETGIDQLMIGRGANTFEGTKKMIDLVGAHVIPKLDTDPVHRTTHHRNKA